MAIIKSAFEMIGGIQGLTFYKQEGSDKVIARSKGGASKEKIKSYTWGWPFAVGKHRGGIRETRSWQPTRGSKTGRMSQDPGGTMMLFIFYRQLVISYII